MQGKCCAGGVVRAAETVFFKLTGVSAAALMLVFDLYDALRGRRCLGVARLWCAHVEQYERDHEQREEP